jgi:hypothetical protein
VGDGGHDPRLRVALAKTRVMVVCFGARSSSAGSAACSYPWCVRAGRGEPLPYSYKRWVIDALLKAVRPGGKVVFVDYHKPHRAHPLKGLTSLIFDLLEPFASSGTERLVLRSKGAMFSPSRCALKFPHSHSNVA